MSDYLIVFILRDDLRLNCIQKAFGFWISSFDYLKSFVGGNCFACRFGIILSFLNATSGL